MAKLFSVCVRPDYRWRKARVAGREFSKAPEVLNEAYIDDEMSASDLLVIEPTGETEPVGETEPAKKPVPRRTSKKAPKAPPEGGDG